MSLTFRKPQSTLGQICLGTWLHCMRSVPHIQTSCAHWAMRRELSRSGSHSDRTTAFLYYIIYFLTVSWPFFSAACAEKATGHHRAPPAEAGSVCHVQQQQVVLHSSVIYILPSSLQWNAAQRRPSMLYPHHHGNPSTTIFHHVLLR